MELMKVNNAMYGSRTHVKEVESHTGKKAIYCETPFVVEHCLNDKQKELSFISCNISKKQALIYK